VIDLHTIDHCLNLQSETQLAELDDYNIETSKLIAQ
jgi:hypothetical protein